MTSLKPTPIIASARRSRLGFWGVALAFATVLGFTTVPTPLWSLFAQRDGLSPLVITLIFGSYAIGVAVSLFLVGHLSDRYGRRRLLVPALVLNVLAGLVFLLWPELTGLLLARALSGFGIGAINATATAWLLELHAGYSGDGDHRRAEVVAVAANLGGLGFGALVSGVLAQWAPAPLTLPFAVFIAALLVALLLVLSAPETRRATGPHARCRPQHLSVPAASRARYLAAAAAAVITFAGFGLLTSLAPSFLSETLHDGSRALAGAVAFAVFASAALAQIVSGSRAPRQLLAGAIPAVLVGLGLLTLATWLPRPSLAMFIAGVLVLGIGSGLMFKAAIATVSSLAAPDHRAGMLAGLFLAAYLGLAGPVIGLGVLTQFLTPQISLLIFAALLAAVLLLATPRLLGRETAPRSRRRLTPHYAPSKIRTGAHHADHTTHDHPAGRHRPRDHQVGFGAWAIGGGGWEFGWGPQDDRESVAAIEHALAQGITWIDTAAAYGFGHSERIVGTVLHNLPEADRPLVFTKASLLEGPNRRVVHSLKRDSLLREVGDSLQRLGVDAIDLYQIHWPIPHEDIEEGWTLLAELKEQRLVRHIGVSNFDVEQLRRIQQIAPVETLQPQYSLIERDIEQDILPFAERERIGVIVYSPMGSGMLTGGMTRERIEHLAEDDWRKTDPRFTEPQLSRNLDLVRRLTDVADRHDTTPGAVAVAWTLHHPAVDGAIVGFRRPGQVDPILAAANLELSDEDLEQIGAVK